MKRPHELVRYKHLHRYFPLERTAFKETIQQLTAKGLLKKVRLRPGGRAVGYTLNSIADCQAALGLEPLDDGGENG